MELLKKLYAISSPSGNEKKMTKLICKFLKEQANGAEIIKDNLGNIFVTKGTADNYPCVCCHTDEVCPKKGKGFEVLTDGNKMFGWNWNAMESVGLGGDDKNGIWCALNLLTELDVIKAAFFVSEETGCVGSAHCELAFFSDCRYVIEIDRRNAGDIITGGRWNHWASDEFQTELCTIGKDFGFKPTDGLTTDVDELSSRGLGISCANLSCGYYNPHTEHDYTIFSELKNTLAFVKAIFQTMTKVYENVPQNHYANSFGGFGGGYGGYYSYMWDYEYDDCFTLMESLYCENPTGFSLDKFAKSFYMDFPHLQKDDYECILKDIVDFHGEMDDEDFDVKN